MKGKKLGIFVAITLVAFLFAGSFSLNVSSSTNNAGQNSHNTAIMSDAAGTVPASSTQRASDNWAGYVVSSNFSNSQPVFWEVDGSWVVQTVTPQFSGQTYESSQWIGIGGWFNGAMIQTGTESNANGNGGTSYYAWYEMIPTATQAGNSTSVIISKMTIHQGDIIDASIYEAGSSSEWTIFIYDTTTGQYYQNNFGYSPDMRSAEWIDERPYDTNTGTYYPLAYFGTAYFGPQYTNGYSNRGYDTNGYIYDINSLPNYELYIIDSSGNMLAQASALGSDGNSFTVTWYAST